MFVKSRGKTQFSPTMKDWSCLYFWNPKYLGHIFKQGTKLNFWHYTTLCKRLQIKISTGIDLIGDYTQLGKYSEFKVYDMTRNWLMEHLVHYH